MCSEVTEIYAPIRSDNVVKQISKGVQPQVELKDTVQRIGKESLTSDLMMLYLRIGSQMNKQELWKQLKQPAKKLCANCLYEKEMRLFHNQSSQNCYPKACLSVFKDSPLRNMWVWDNETR